MLRRDRLNFHVLDRCFLRVRVQILLLAGYEVQNRLTRQFSVNTRCVEHFELESQEEIPVFRGWVGGLFSASHELRHVNCEC